MTLALSPTRPKRRAAKSSPLTAAEFFAGIGLVRLALERHNFRVVFANDIDPGMVLKLPPK